MTTDSQRPGGLPPREASSRAGLPASIVLGGQLSELVWVPRETLPIRCRSRLPIYAADQGFEFAEESSEDLGGFSQDFERGTSRIFRARSRSSVATNSKIPSGPSTGSGSRPGPAGCSASLGSPGDAADTLPIPAADLGFEFDPRNPPRIWEDFLKISNAARAASSVPAPEARSRLT
jgi:hypothetical protein